MIEVEIKLPVYRQSTTQRALLEAGFQPGDLVRESDIYFTSDFHDFMEKDEALRIRSSENLTTGAASSFLTFKGPKLDQVSMTRKELETEVEDADVCRQILLSLGYREITPVRKLRQYYFREDVHACLDTVEGLGVFLELEILVEEEGQRDEALKKTEAILRDLGHDMNETTRYSYLYMLQKKG